MAIVTGHSTADMGPNKQCRQETRIGQNDDTGPAKEGLIGTSLLARGGNVYMLHELITCKNVQEAPAQAEQQNVAHRTSRLGPRLDGGNDVRLLLRVEQPLVQLQALDHVHGLGAALDAHGVLEEEVLLAPHLRSTAARRPFLRTRRMHKALPVIVSSRLATYALKLRAYMVINDVIANMINIKTWSFKMLLQTSLVDLVPERVKPACLKGTVPSPCLEALPPLMDNTLQFLHWHATSLQ